MLAVEKDGFYCDIFIYERNRSPAPLNFLSMVQPLSLQPLCPQALHFLCPSCTAAANAYRMLASAGRCTKPPSHSDNASRRDRIIIISALEKTNSVGEAYVAGQGRAD